MNAKIFIKTKTKWINLRRNRIGALNRIDSTCLQTTGIENGVCQYSGFSSALTQDAVFDKSDNANSVGMLSPK